LLAHDAFTSVAGFPDYDETFESVGPGVLKAFVPQLRRIVVGVVDVCGASSANCASANCAIGVIGVIGVVRRRGSSSSGVDCRIVGGRLLCS